MIHIYGYSSKSTGRERRSALHSVCIICLVRTIPTHLHMDSDTQRGARHAPFDEESMFALLVKAIKRFLARLCQGFAPISSSPVRSSDASGPMSVNMSAASVLSG